MLARAKKDQEYFDRAYELAYFIHANKGIALYVAEEAWCKLEPALGRQDRRWYDSPSGRRHERGRPTRPGRTKIRLEDEPVRQRLVSAESDAWERCTEYGDSPYPLTEAEETFWQQTLRAPAVSVSRHVHILNVELSPEQFPTADSYELRVEGGSGTGWQSLTSRAASTGWPMTMPGFSPGQTSRSPTFSDSVINAIMTSLHRYELVQKYDVERLWEVTCSNRL